MTQAIDVEMKVMNSYGGRLVWSGMAMDYRRNSRKADLLTHYRA